MAKLDAKKVEALTKFAENNKGELVQFLREFIALPSLSGQEKAAADCLKFEMEKVGFDEVYVDAVGNVVGRIGSGSKVILYDAHMDIVPAGDPKNWRFDPFEGKLENGIIYGRGACDDKQCLAAMVYAGKAIKELNLEDDYTLYVVGVVCEEVGEGMAVKSFIEEKGIKPDFVLIGESSSLTIRRGHRGRALLEAVFQGKSGHPSQPEAADNALYKAARFILKVEELNKNLPPNEELGKGSAAVTAVEIGTKSAIPGECKVTVDRRVTFDEAKEGVVEELRELAESDGGTLEIISVNEKTYPGKELVGEEFFPSWVLEENHPLVQGAREAYEKVYNETAEVKKWGFSTDGVYTAGVAGIPTVGFGPGDESLPHSENDQVSVEELVKSIPFYAAFPLFLP